MDTPAASALLESLEHSDYRGLYHRFSSFLQPFGDFIPLDSHDPQKPATISTTAPTRRATNKKPGKKKDERKKKKPDPDPKLLRPLAKQFLPFICRALHLLPALLRRVSKGGEAEGDRARELLGVYALALDCLGCISPCLAGKPYSVHLQRGRLICYLEAWGMYAEAEEEGLALLDALCSLLAPAASRARKGKSGVGTIFYLPDPEAAGASDPEVATLAAEITISLASCAHKTGARDGGVYERVLALVEQLQPWLQIMDVEAYSKYSSLLVNTLYRCSLLLAEKAMSFDADLVQRFCLTMLRECLKSSLVDNFPSIARKICSSVDLGWKGCSLLFLDILRITLESMVCGCKGALVNVASEFLEFVSYCADIFLTASTDIRSDASKLLYKRGVDFLQVSPPVASILILYATGLCFKPTNVHARKSDYIIQSPNDEPATISLLDYEGHPQDLADSLGNLARYFRVTDCSKDVTSDNELEDVKHMLFVEQKSTKFGNCQLVHGYASLSSYLDVLEFLCRPLVEFVNAAWQKIFSEKGAVPCIAQINYVQDALHQFCDVVLTAFRCPKLSERERERLHDSRRTFLQVVVVAFKTSIAFSGNCQKSISSISCVISSDWIEPQELKFLISALHNIGASLYNSGQLEQASSALQLCCVTIWTYVELLCRAYSDKSKGTYDENKSGEAIKDSITNSFVKIATILEVLHKCGANDIHDILMKSLHTLCAVGEIFQSLNCSLVLVKQWAKIMCKDYDAVDVVDGAPVLYSLLLSKCWKLSNKTLSKILEQELVSYEMLEARNPNLCQTMQLKVIDILLSDVYVTEDYYLKRSSALIRKGRTLRARGIGMGSCFECLSEAISLLKGISGDPSQANAAVYHHLALAYCLHAQCAQETNQDFEVIVDDIHCAVNLWSSIDIQTNYSADSGNEFSAVDTIQLLCYTVDLLSLKGCLKFQFDIYKLIITFCKLEDIPLEKCLAMLWSDKRLNHSVCICPIDEVFILHMCQQLNTDANSVDFWISCLKGSASSQLSFLQSLLIYDSILPEESLRSSKRSFALQVTVDEVKAAASSLISCVPVASQSAFMASNLCHDLSERFSLSGRLYEALSYAREALRMRRKILGRKFSYSFQLQSANFVDPGKITCNNSDHCHLETSGSVITEVWPDFNRPRKMQECILSPWNVLRCYLESTLQVAVLHESIGNGAEAEILLDTGKKISCLQGLPLFEIAFTSILGRLYRKKHLWDLAENELHIARRLLAENDVAFSCKRCKLTFEVAIDMQLGDLARNLFEKSLHTESINSISHALDLYRSALEKLNSAEVEGSHNFFENPQTEGTLFSTGHFDKGTYGGPDISSIPSSNMEIRSLLCSICASYQASNVCCDGEMQLEECQNLLSSKVQGGGSHANMGVRKRSKNQLKEQKFNVSDKLRNCLNKQSCYNEYMKVTCEGARLYDKSTIHNCKDDPNSGKSQMKQNRTLLADFGCHEACICNKTKCWRCLLIKVMESGSLHNIMYLKWESHRRRLLVRLLLKIARCLGARGGHCGAHRVHEVFWQCISLLFNRRPFSETSRIPSSHIINLIGEEISGDIFPIERAVILYHISWFCLKDSFSENCRSTCCCLSSIQMANVVPWLLRAFILCREFPLLFQKISKLLASICLLSTLENPISWPLYSEKTLSISHWAAYFHQASVGSFLHGNYLSCAQDKLCNAKVLQDPPRASVDKLDKASNLLRLAPEKLEYLEEIVRDFYQALCNVPIICLTMLDDDYVNLLGETLLLPSYFPAWMLLSRFCANGQPITMLLPVDIISEDVNSGEGFMDENKGSIQEWQCPWGYTIVDYVAPSYKLLLEENFLSLSSVTSANESGQMNCVSWWSQRNRLNNWMDNLLRSMENRWLGPWCCLLLGELSDCEYLDLAVRNLINMLKSRCKLEANENLLKAILGGCNVVADAEACISQLIRYKGYFGRGGCCGEERLRAFSIMCHQGTENDLELVHEIIVEAIEHAEQVEREPVILVLDSNVQMLPWENLPVMRRQEAYRMPSVGSISVALCRSYNNNKQVKTFGAVFPSIDPLNTYYLLNPSGDLTNTQVEFEQWFRKQKWEGKAGDVPTTEELALALQKHDLFLYFGHGSGIQYISGREIQKLDCCAATVLMGCSSGSLTQKGCYAPQGAPLSYLLAGSPAVIANLWEVTDKDIDRFGKAILNSWLEDESFQIDCCPRCNHMVKEFSCMGINEGNASLLRNRKKTRGTRKLRQSCNTSVCKDSGRRKRIASFMSQARDACRLPLLIGASPVCYGIPTVVKKS